MILAGCGRGGRLYSGKGKSVRGGGHAENTLRTLRRNKRTLKVRGLDAGDFC